MKTRSKVWLWCIIACLFLEGCGRADRVTYYLGRKSNKPVLLIGKLTITFEEVNFQGPDNGPSPTSYNLSGRFNVPDQMSNVTQIIPDIGTKEGKIDIKESFGGGVNTISIGGGTFRLMEQGTQAGFANMTLPINERSMAISVDKAGNATIVSGQ